MRNEVSQLIERGNQTPFNKLLSFFWTDAARKQIASNIYPKLYRGETSEYTGKLAVYSYTGDNKCISEIRNYLEASSHPAIAAALIHGSIATDEVVNYSDFDGILIIDEKRIESVYSLQSLLSIISKTSTMMLQQDPLQHHGWNILTQSECAQYPDDTLPLVLLENSKLIVPQSTFSLYYHLDQSALNYQQPLRALCQSLERKVSNATPGLSFRHFKNWVSEILLLPAVFIQAKTSKPISKKESFEAMKIYLPSKSCSVINEYSKLRLSWNQEEASISTELQYLKWKPLGKIANNFATPLPQRYRNWATFDKLKSIKDLTRQLLEAI